LLGVTLFNHIEDVLSTIFQKSPTFILHRVAVVNSPIYSQLIDMSGIIQAYKKGYRTKRVGD